MSPITRLRENPRWVVVALGRALGAFAAPVASTSLGSFAPMGPLGVVGFDKWVHAARYVSLGFASASAVCVRRYDEVAAAVLVAGAFGAGIEFMWAVLSYRSLGVADAGANLAGAILGGVVWATAARVVDA